MNATKHTRRLPDWPALMGEAMAAAYLGRSTAWLHDMRKAGKVPPRVQAGGSWMYRQTDLALWVASLPSESERIKEQEQLDADEAFNLTSRG